MNSFEDPHKAVEYAKQLTLSYIIHKADEVASDAEPTNEIAYISVEVETVVDAIDEDTRFVGAIYKSKIWVRKEDVTFLESDYSILEDGTLKVSCELLEGFNKGDSVAIKFADKTGASVITYDIIAKDEDYFICELTFI
jgi:hypothetical protein